MSTATASSPTGVSPPSPLLLSALTALTALSIDMSLPALPELQRVFHASSGTAQLTLGLFLIGYALGQLICGPLSDRWGRRPVLLVGLVAFTLVGVACALSPTLPVLIALRLFQGMAASVGPILARAIVRDCFDSQHAAAILSQITQVMVIAPLLAPTLGGYLLTQWGWRSIFGALGVSGLLLGLVCGRYLSETIPEKHADTHPWVRVRAGFRAVFSHRESLRHTLTVCFAYSGMFAYISGSPFVFMEGFHVARQNFGYCFALTAGALMVGASVNRYLLTRRHTAPRLLLRRGALLLAVAGIVLLVLNLGGRVGLAGVVVPMMAYLFGLGLVLPNATAAAMEPHGKMAGVSSSVIGCLQTGGGALAGYVVGAFFDGTPHSLAATVAFLSVFACLTALVRGQAA